MGDEPYGTLAGVYDLLVPETMIEPRENVAAFSDAVKELQPGARVLDCAAGTGLLAVGLAALGFEVVATDASSAMIERIRALAVRYDTQLRAIPCAWEGLDRQGWQRHFDAVFCVGNSLPHAIGQVGRRAALAAMAGVLRPEGLLVVTSRNWERLRTARPRLQVADRLTERAGRRGMGIYAWEIPDTWDEPHHVTVAVAVIAETGRVKTYSERLTFWPFRYDSLNDDLRAAGLTPSSSSYTLDADRYVIMARCVGAATVG